MDGVLRRTSTTTPNVDAGRRRRATPAFLFSLARRFSPWKRARAPIPNVGGRGCRCTTPGCFSKRIRRRVRQRRQPTTPVDESPTMARSGTSVTASRSSASAMEFVRRTRPGFPAGLEVVIAGEDNETRAASVRLLESNSYRVTVVSTLKEVMGSLMIEPAPRRDVVLIEASLLREGMEDDSWSCRERFPAVAKKVAIVVLQHDNAEEKDREFIMDAIRMGVVDVIRYPLIKQRTANLWQHAVRKMFDHQKDSKMIEVLKRSNDTNVHNFSAPYCGGLNARDPAALGEAQLRAPTPPMSVEAMNLRQAKLLAEFEARKAQESARGEKPIRPAKEAPKKSVTTKQPTAGSSNSHKGDLAPRVTTTALRGSSPDEMYAQGASGSALPAGLKLKITESFIRSIDAGLQGQSDQLLGIDATAPDGGSYPTFDTNLFKDLMDCDMGPYDGDALDAVLNSNDFFFDDIVEP